MGLSSKRDVKRMAFAGRHDGGKEGGGGVGGRGPCPVRSQPAEPPIRTLTCDISQTYYNICTGSGNDPWSTV